MVKAEEVEDVPGWTFRPDETLGGESSRPVRVYADGASRGPVGSQ